MNIGTGIHHHAILTTHTGPNSLFKPGIEMLSCCSSWGSRPKWNCSHIHSKHMQSVWDHSYAVDHRYWDQSSCHYHNSGWHILWIRAKFPGHTWNWNNFMLQWLRLQTHIKWFSHLLQTYSKWFRTFICCGWALGSIIMPYSQHMLALGLRRCFQFTPGIETMACCSGWGSRPTLNDSHHIFWHMQSVWDHSYVVDEHHCNPSSCHYHNPCWHRFWVSAKFPVRTWNWNNVMLQWLKLQTHIKWFSHLLQTYSKWFRTYICCGWAL